jgi:hypothetical protein
MDNMMMDILVNHVPKNVVPVLVKLKTVSLVTYQKELITLHLAHVTMDISMSMVTVPFVYTNVLNVFPLLLSVPFVLLTELLNQSVIAHLVIMKKLVTQNVHHVIQNVTLVLKLKEITVPNVTLD